MSPLHRMKGATALGLVMAVTAGTGAALAQDSSGKAVTLEKIEIVGTAEEELKQMPGVSIITEEDIKKQPPVNDLSEIIRKMPGVNLTGNSASGQYGNNRQIDLRGMGPENTLILVDGKPVSSRNSVRMGRSGERNTRGDSNWVPVEAVERIEVIRGPAAARYGSGAAGGVVNIITKKPSDTMSGSVSLYANQPEDSDEGDTQRVGFSVNGPVAEDLSFRVYGSYNRTDADSLSLNETAAGTAPGAVPPAGREGVRNKDVNALLRWDVTEDHVLEFEGAYSHQGNIYAGDRAVSSTGSPLLEQMANGDTETNTMERKTISVTHRGQFDFGTSRLLFQYEDTDNTRMDEGLAGASEGSINSTDKSTSKLKNYYSSGEVNVPFLLGYEQVMTAGFEVRREELNDPHSMSQSQGGGAIPGLPAGDRDPNSSVNNFALFVEDNIEVTRDLMLTPGIRLDHHSEFGSQLSPALNASYRLTDAITLKGGIAQAFKAPNLYQSNPNYLYYTRSNGCPVDYPSLGSGCYVQGNENLDAETSLNKEIGISYDKEGWLAGLTYFHNDYKDKIIAGMTPVGQTATSGRIFQWTNAPEAVVQGFEGNLTVPLHPAWSWSTNFTYMIENEDQTTGEPLSIIPKYTINSWLDWEATRDLNLRLSVTHYGKQTPRNLTSRGDAATGDQLKERDPYSIVGVSATYALTASTTITGGVSNIFDERLYREHNSSGAGANTYNEPGRAYYVSLTTTF